MINQCNLTKFWLQYIALFSWSNYTKLSGGKKKLFKSFKNLSPVWYLFKSYTFVPYLKKKNQTFFNTWKKNFLEHHGQSGRSIAVAELLEILNYREKILQFYNPDWFILHIFILGKKKSICLNILSAKLCACFFSCSAIYK